jgi:hypothetical protein
MHALRLLAAALALTGAFLLFDGPALLTSSEEVEQCEALKRISALAGHYRDERCDGAVDPKYGIGLLLCAGLVLLFAQQSTAAPRAGDPSTPVDGATGVAMTTPAWEPPSAASGGLPRPLKFVLFLGMLVLLAGMIALGTFRGR